MRICIYIYTYTYIYIHIYIYTRWIYTYGHHHFSWSFDPATNWVVVLFGKTVHFLDNPSVFEVAGDQPARVSFKRWFESSFIELDDGNFYRKPLYLMVKTMVSCRFSLKPIHWQLGFTKEVGRINPNQPHGIIHPPELVGFSWYSPVNIPEKPMKAMSFCRSFSQGNHFPTGGPPTRRPGRRGHAKKPRRKAGSGFFSEQISTAES